ncbi:hypothetical protein [Halorussus pelagicus]|uniref:hypothetical protein n=1 Tax=Halorussus pelagicus TaxID=2505977 RepID=UPI000FFBDB1E|nr:hypothetical protein [Halorussus pelagicus]
MNSGPLRRRLPESTATNGDNSLFNKRTLLGVQCWIIGALSALDALLTLMLGGILLAAPLFALGAYLVFGTTLAPERAARTYKFLLYPE